ncbi:hypothetical protein JKF63_07152 [Porcisia hertigi]|uniref:Uncharacterized protein n=1 Tax=Porcisia hertigi TaxID=2761500 RepID=A0A836LKF1_9TRYP|nr:hypothetical protein JKF63_07152 [Porcisia hertigi]
MDVDSEVEPLLKEMSKRLAVVREDLLPALRSLDEDTLLSYYSVDEQARLYLSAAFTLALSLYSLDKITHRQVLAGGGGCGAAASSVLAASSPSSLITAADTQLALKIDRITGYIKKLQELATLERQRKTAAPAADPLTGVVAPTATTAKRPREEDLNDTPATVAEHPAKKAKEENGANAMAPQTRSEDDDDDLGDAQMFSVVSRVAGETGTLVGRLVKQVMSSSALTGRKDE